MRKSWIAVLVCTTGLLALPSVGLADRDDWRGGDEGWGPGDDYPEYGYQESPGGEDWGDDEEGERWGNEGWGDEGWGREGGEGWGDEGWGRGGRSDDRRVAVGYDWDRDGRFDDFELISANELKRARQRSREHQEPGQAWRGGEEWGQKPMAGPTQQVRGEIASLKTVDVVGLRQSYVVALVEKPSGQIVHVLLGPRRQISDLDLQQGDRIQVIGRPGMLNDRSVLVAGRINSNGQSASVGMPPGSGELRRFDGTIESVRIGTSRRTGSRHLFAKVRLDNGQTALVNFGLVGRVQDADLQPGDFVAFLARETTANDHPCLRVAEFHTGGETYRTDYVQGAQASAMGRW